MKQILGYILFVFIWINTAIGIAENRLNVSHAFSTETSLQLEINGKVVNKETGEAIPFCNIGNISSTIGTSSNELGEFVIRVDSLPAKLIFSHINYGKFVVEINQTSDLLIKLVSLTTDLEEVIVIASKKDAYALELAKKAFQKANDQSTQSKYGKAFYRQKSKNGDHYSEFSEIIYDIRYNTTGIEDWDILEGRYALNPGGVHNKNYSLLSRLLSPFQPDTDELIFPMHGNLESFYKLHIIEYIPSGDQKIAVLGFEPIKSLYTPIFNAEVYINTQTYDILKVVGNISRNDLKFVQLVEKNSIWKNYNIGFEIAYRQDSTANSAIDYVKIDQGFDYYKNDSLKFHSASTSNLTFFEHYTPTSRKKLGGQFSKNTSDWQKLDEIGYNEKFWEENPIVKRTPVEEEVITSFRRANAFGSIFLNSKDQVALLQSDLVNDAFIKELGMSVNYYNNYNPVEKVYLHTDKEIFAAGETIWYSGYAVLGSFHHFSLASRVLHVDLVGPHNEIALSQTQAIVNGKAIGSIELPENLPTGYYQLRSYTNWMRNDDQDFFFSKTIKVLNEDSVPLPASSKDEKIDLQFFPEGGHLVANLMGQVAFKAIGSDGLGRNIQGHLIDSHGKLAATLGTIDRGAGFFSFKPLAGEQYTAVLGSGAEYPFPKIMDEGYAILVNNLNPKSVQVKVQATELLREQPFYLVGHVNNKRYYQGKFDFGSKPTVNIEIPKSKIPSGLMTLTLFDAQKRPWCERLVFINNQQDLVISTNISPRKFDKRDEVAIAVHVTDTDGRAVSAELSLAVTDAGQTVKDPNASNILTHLLLQSDIKGHITDPGLLFKDQKRATLHSLDLVMLTHGWRKFPWPEVEAKSTPPKEFNFTKGLMISGIAHNLNKKPLARATLNVIAKSGGQLGMFSATTALDGTFSIPDFNFQDSTDIAFNAFDNADRPIDVKVTLNTHETMLPLPNFKGVEFIDTEETERYINVVSAQRKLGTLFDFKKTTKLDEVVVTDKKIEKSRNQSPSVYGQRPDATLYMEDHKAAQTVLALVSRFSGVSVNGTTVSIRNGGTPLWVLNGIPVGDNNPSASTTARQNQLAERSSRQATGDARPVTVSLSVEQSITPNPVPTYIATMDTFTVERVELLKGPSAAIYGSRGANGVILIYTKRGGEGKTVDPVIAPDFRVPGHAIAKEFYAPKYNVALDEQNTTDYRSTLYWNPSFTTDKNGNARLLFYNSDKAQQIQVSIEGLSPYGSPGAYLQTFGVME